MLTQTHISLLKYISNNPNTNLNQMSTYFSRTPTYIRREIALLNVYLDNNFEIKIKNSEIKTDLDYESFLIFMENLPIFDYAPNQIERHKSLIVQSFFEEFLNLTEIYNQWNLSLTTKKNDLKALEKYIAPFNLYVKRFPGIGIKIEGDLLQYRNLITQILIDCSDIFDSKLTIRRANTPIEKQLYNYVFGKTKDHYSKTTTTIQNFLDEYQININYHSKKFFFLYVLLVYYQNKKPIKNIKRLQLEPLNFYLFENRNENIAFNQIVSMIDFDPLVIFPHNEVLMALTQNFANDLETHLEHDIHTKKEMVEDLYNFIYRQYFYNHFNYIFQDKLVTDTALVFPNLFRYVESRLNNIESFFNFKFHDEQIASLTLIAEKWHSKNQLYGKMRKKIILVTNIGFERVDYFIETLKNYVDFEHISTIDVNELHLLENYNFDLILTFSNRTTSILHNLGYNSIKIAYFLDHNNILKLYNAGCSIAKKRIVSASLIDELSDKNDLQKIEFLKEHYDHLFL